MADFQAKKIPIFSDVNDLAIAPTANSGGNISHFYDLYNQLVDDLEESITDVEEIAGDGLDTAQYADASAYDYYYYTALPNRNYIIFQNNNTSFDLGNHDLVSGSNTIGNIPANGELFRIIAEGNITNFDNIQWEIGGNVLTVTKVASYSTGSIWWFYDISKLYPDPYGYTSEEVTENDAINLITTNAETNINFRLEMTVYSVEPSTSEPTLEVYEFSEISTIDLGGGNYGGIVGTIPKTGKLQKIAVNDIGDGYGTFFSTNGGNSVLTFDAFEIATEGYQWTISDDDSQDVTQGQELSFQTTAEELNRTFYLYIYG
ncbi:MAG: hypothetical protein QNJ65_19995 [Xenococcaceae cyanobacterium MO_234.B1]|nr:hypothetical protein [Xenococcaceae cyanobacterium MO_234.B1]